MNEEKKKTLADLDSGLYHIEVKDVSKESYYLAVEKQSRSKTVFTQIQCGGHCYSDISPKDAKDYPITYFKSVKKLDELMSYVEILP